MGYACPLLWASTVNGENPDRDVKEYKELIENLENDIPLKD